MRRRPPSCILLSARRWFIRLLRETKMNIEQVRLFELQIKGDRLGELNAEEVLDRRAAAQARTRSLLLFTSRIGPVYRQALHWWAGKLTVLGQSFKPHPFPPRSL